jgi:DNA-binding response OmpR family regulator
MTEKKILLVEDDLDVARAMAVRLRSRRYVLSVAADGISAISMARKEKPDLIVLDLGLSCGDGFTVMQRLKSSVDLMLIPIIVVSARDPLVNEHRALEAGAELFFQKPVDNEEFLTAVERALSRGSATRVD